MPRTTKATAPATPATRHVLREKAVIAAAEAFVSAKAEVAQLGAKLEGLKAQLLAAMGEHSECVAGNRVLTKSEVKGTAPTANVTITKAMIGQVIPGKSGKKGYTQLTVQ
jgi:hypothetical protein